MTTLSLPTSPSWSLGLRRLLAAWRRHWQERRERAEFQQLDAAALRDLGLDRSEYDSCHREAEGEAPSTRRRLARRR